MWLPVKRAGNKSKVHDETAHVECHNRFEVLDQEDFFENLSGSPPNKQDKNKIMSKAKRKPQLPRTNTELNLEGRTLMIIADSHGNDLSSLVQQRTSINVQSVVRPGASLYSVTHDIQTLTANLTKKDHLLLVAGTNSVEKTGVKRLTDDLFKTVNQLNQTTNVILASLPMRHDNPRLDLKVSHINATIERFVIRSTSIKLLPLHNLPRHLYTLHGLNLNRKGKEKI